LGFYPKVFGLKIKESGKTMVFGFYQRREKGPIFQIPPFFPSNPFGAGYRGVPTNGLGCLSFSLWFSAEKPTFFFNTGHMTL